MSIKFAYANPQNEKVSESANEEKGSADLLTLFVRSARKKGETLSQVELRDLYDKLSQGVCSHPSSLLSNAAF